MGWGSEMSSRKFPKELLQELAWDDAPNPYIKVDDSITNNSRWSIHHTMVFKADDGLHYRVGYSVGSTECQDERPFEYDDDEIECTQVEKVAKTIMVWQPTESV